MESLFQFKEIFLEGSLSGNMTVSEKRYLFYTNEKIWTQKVNRSVSQNILKLI
jgi:hypothetical protein